MLASATRRASVTVSVRQIEGLVRRQLLELGAAQPQHQAVAQGRHGGRAHAAGQEGDLADRLAGTELGDGHRGGQPR